MAIISESDLREASKKIGEHVEDTQGVLIGIYAEMGKKLGITLGDNIYEYFNSTAEAMVNANKTKLKKINDSNKELQEILKRGHELEVTLLFTAEEKKLNKIKDTYKQKRDLANEYYNTEMAILEKTLKGTADYEKRIADMKAKQAKVLNQLDTQEQTETGNKVKDALKSTSFGSALANALDHPISALIAAASKLALYQLDLARQLVPAEATLKAATRQAGNTNAVGITNGIPSGLLSPVEALMYQVRLAAQAPGRDSRNNKKIYWIYGLFRTIYRRKSKIINKKL